MSVRRTTGSRIGPEPTTDRFVAVMHGPDERIVRFPGHSFRIRLSHDADIKDSMSTNGSVVCSYYESVSSHRSCSTHLDAS